MHNSLKEGLLALGHQVILVSSGDLFKNYPSDISIRPRFSNHKWLMLFRKILFRLFKYDYATTEKGLRFYANLNKMHNFDVVQLINEYAIETHLPFEKFLLKKIIKHNKKMFVLGSIFQSFNNARPQFAFMTGNPLGSFFVAILRMIRKRGHTMPGTQYICKWRRGQQQVFFQIFSPLLQITFVARCQQLLYMFRFFEDSIQFAITF